MPNKLKTPELKQKVRIIRPLYTHNGTDSMYFGVGATAVVEEINIDKEQGTCIGIDFDIKQETENLTKRIKSFVDEFNNGENRYYFYDSCTGCINKMDIGGLLEFHMCCDFIE